MTATAATELTGPFKKGKQTVHVNTLWVVGVMHPGRPSSTQDGRWGEFSPALSAGHEPVILTQT